LIAAKGFAYFSPVDPNHQPGRILYKELFYKMLKAYAT
jgi:hypothetical protein